MTKTETLEKVRQIFYQGPGAEGWEGLCDALWEEENREHLQRVVLPYCEHHLAQWPSHLRRVSLPQIASRHPVIPLARELSILVESTPGQYFGDAAEHPVLAQIGTRRRPSVRVKGLLEIAQRETWGTLEKLSLEADKIGGTRGFKKLLSSPLCAHLRGFDFQGCKLESPMLKALSLSHLPSQVHELRLCKVRLGGERLSHLLGPGTWEDLRVLDIQDNRILCEDVERIAASSCLQGLHTLRMGNEIASPDMAWNYNRIQSEGFRSLASSSYLRGLTHLHLAHNRIEDDGIEILQEKEVWPHLRELNLQGNRLGLSGWMSLATSPCVRHLESLNLGHQKQRLGARAFVRWVERLEAPRLRALNLHGTKMGASGLAALLKKFEHGQLEHLDLGGNQIKDKMLKALVESPAVSSLTSLSLRSNPITEEGVRMLRRAPRLSGLAHLHLEGTNTRWWMDET